MTWLVKDGLGMIGRILFSYAKGFTTFIISHPFFSFQEVNSIMIARNGDSSPIFSMMPPFSSICYAHCGRTGKGYLSLEFLIKGAKKRRDYTKIGLDFYRKSY